jgi:hypothetical protein
MSALRIRLASLSAALVVASASAAGAQQSPSTPVPPPAPPAADAAAPQETRAAPARETRRRRADRDRLEGEEIEQNQATLYDAYSLVTSLRPTWLAVRRGSMMLTEGVRVYRDGMGMGGVNALRQIPTSSIERIEHLDDGQATMRFGTGHGSGAILVFTRQ